MAQESGSVCCQLKFYCQSGHPYLSDIAGSLKLFVLVKDELSIVIPQSMRSEILTKIHFGHQGITKWQCSQCAWWPAISKDIG